MSNKKLYNEYKRGDFMASEECSKCWFRYIEECDGQENFKEDDCKKKNIIVEELEEDTNVGVENDGL